MKHVIVAVMLILSVPALSESDKCKVESIGVERYLDAISFKDCKKIGRVKMYTNSSSNARDDVRKQTLVNVALTALAQNFEVTVGYQTFLNAYGNRVWFIQSLDVSR